MDYLLDTTILIDLLRQKTEAWDFLEKHSEDNFLTSSICEAEAWEGVYREKKADFGEKKKGFQRLLSSLSEIIPFDSIQAEIAGQIRSKFSIRGERIGDLDILIAASVISTQATLLTKNINVQNIIQ